MSATLQMLEEAKTLPIGQVAPWMFSRLVSLKKYPHAEELLDIFDLFFLSCVHLKHLFFIKEGVYRIRGICISTNDFSLLNSVCDNLIDMISLETESVESSQLNSPVQLSNIPFFDTKSNEASIKFKYECIRLILDLLKYKNHNAYIKAFEFTVKCRKVKDCLKLSYDVLKNKTPLMQLGYSAWFKLSLSHLKALLQLELYKQSTVVANDIVSSLLNANDGFGGISLSLFAADLVQDQQQQQDISGLVDHTYICNHPLFELLCQFYHILAMEPTFGSLVSYKHFSLILFKSETLGSTLNTSEALEPIVLSIMASDFTNVNSSILSHLGYSSIPSSKQVIKNIIEKHSSNLSTLSLKICSIYLNAPVYQWHSLSSLITLPVNLKYSLIFKIVSALSKYYSSIPYAKLQKYCFQCSPDELESILLDFDLPVTLDKVKNVFYFNRTPKFHYFETLSQIVSSIDPELIKKENIALIPCARLRFNKDKVDSNIKDQLNQFYASEISTIDTLLPIYELSKKIDAFKNKRTVLEKQHTKKLNEQVLLQQQQVQTEKQMKDNEIKQVKQSEIDAVNLKNLHKEQKIKVLATLEQAGIHITQHKKLTKEEVDEIAESELNELKREQKGSIEKHAKQVDHLERALVYENDLYTKKHAEEIHQQELNAQQELLDKRAQVEAVKEQKLELVKSMKAKYDSDLNTQQKALEQEFEKTILQLQTTFKQNQAIKNKELIKEMRENIEKAKQELLELKEKEKQRQLGSTAPTPYVDPADKDNDWRRGAPVPQQEPAQAEPEKWRAAPVQKPAANKYVPPSSTGTKYVPPALNNKYVPPASTSTKYVPPSMSNRAPVASKYVAPSTGKYVAPSSGKYVAPSSGKYVPRSLQKPEEKKEEDSGWRTVRK